MKKIILALIAIIVLAVILLIDKTNWSSVQPQQTIVSVEKLDNASSIPVPAQSKPHSPSVKLLSPHPYDDSITLKSQRSIRAFNRHKQRLIREFSEKGLRFGSPIFMRLFKQESTLEIWVQEPNKDTFKLFKTYPIATFSGTLGPKFAEGDKQSPEGFYFVPANMMNPNSRFHLSFNLGFPNTYDRANHRTGSALMVHGNRVSIGCYAMTDRLIEEIYTIADVALGSGQKFFRVHIFPFHLTDGELAKKKNSPHFNFWKNLQTGYRWFENKKIPPNVGVKNQQYIFN